MSKERLSKLQKWILEKCNEADQKDFSGVLRSALLTAFFSYKWESTGKLINWNNAQVILTKSLKNLARRGYIELMGTTRTIDPESRDAVSKMVFERLDQGRDKEEILREMKEKFSLEDLGNPFQLRYVKISIPIKPGDKKHKIKAVCITERGKQKIRDMELSSLRKRLVKGNA